MAERMIFVFGSNLAGRHGRGAALSALREHGAVYGQGIGAQGTSYAIPTKDWALRTLPLEVIARHVSEFLKYARANSHCTFNVTRVGCGLAGYTPADIAPLFSGSPTNCQIPPDFVQVIGGALEQQRKRAVKPS